MASRKLCLWKRQKVHLYKGHRNSKLQHLKNIPTNCNIYLLNSHHKHSDIYFRSDKIDDIKTFAIIPPGCPKPKVWADMITSKLFSRGVLVKIMRWRMMLGRKSHWSQGMCPRTCEWQLIEYQILIGNRQNITTQKKRDIPQNFNGKSSEVATWKNG